MKAGKLRDRILIQSGARTTDSQGGFTVVWSTIADGSRWANVRDARANEVWLHDQTQHSVGFVVETRYVTGVTADMRIVWGSRTFRITGVRNPDGVKRTLLIDCLEIPAGVAT